MTDTAGHCLCGAVGFSATDVIPEAGACHCEMCRRWSGSAFIGVDVSAANMTVTGAKNITTYPSSEWGTRSFCSVCGSTLWWRSVGKDSAYEISLGLFDDPSAFEMTREIFIDRKPDSFAYAGERTQLTEAEAIEMFAAREGDS